MLSTTLCMTQMSKQCLQHHQQAHTSSGDHAHCWGSVAGSTLLANVSGVECIANLLGSISDRGGGVLDGVNTSLGGCKYKATTGGVRQVCISQSATYCRAAMRGEAGDKMNSPACASGCRWVKTTKLGGVL
jgi:hypothetical protein